MRHNVNYEKPLPGYKIPNSNFPKQLCAFLSQSKHQKHEQFSDINQYMVEQFIHLFEICNINRFIDYTKEFINEIRNVILRLEIVEKKPFESLDDKDQFIYLIVEGRVQRMQKAITNLCRRVSKFNMTGYVFQSSSLMGHFNPRSSHQTLHNIQLKQFQKSIIMDRSSRMSITNGNLWNEMISSPKKKNKMQEKSYKSFGSICFNHTQSQTSSEFFLNTTLVPTTFQQKMKEQKDDSCIEENKKDLIPKQSNQYGTQLLQPFPDEIYQCLSTVKCIKLLKWSYDQLVQYVYKYQNDKLIEFLSSTLYISQHDIKFHQVYNKIAFHFYPKKQSQHSNMYIGLEEGALYVLRKGAIEMKYECKSSFGKVDNNNSKLLTESRSNPNLAQYVNHQQIFYKKIVQNEGAIICPELESHAFFIQALEDVVLIEIDHHLLEVLKSQLKDNWWSKKLKSSYEKIKEDRSLYMKDEEICQKQEFKELKMNNVSIDSKSKKFRSGNKQKARFRAQPKKMDENESFIRQKQDQSKASEDKQNMESEFNSEQYRQFISFLPYEIMIKSKQKISMKLKEKSKIKHVSSKVFNYLKKNQKGLSSAKSKEKVLALKMKNIASKQINIKDLQNLQHDINNDEAKKEFHRSLKGNWFKQETSISSDPPAVDQNNVPRISVTQIRHRKTLLVDKKDVERYRSSIQIGGIWNKVDHSNKRITIDTIQNHDKKVTFKGGIQDQSSDEQYLCKDDTGLINKFIQNSHNYQKQLSYLINVSKLEEKTQLKQHKRLKTCKTEGSNLAHSQHLIKDMIKRVNHSNKKSMVSNISHKDSEKLSRSAQKSKSVSVHDKKPFQNQGQGYKRQENLLKETENSYKNEFSSLLTGMVGKKVEIHDSSQLFVGWNDEKENDKNGQQNLNYVKSSSCKLLKYSNPKGKHSCLDKKRTSINIKKQSYLQSTFIKEPIQRPMTAQPQLPGPREQCRSLFFNQWIDSETDTSMKYRNSDLGVPNFNFYERNISSGDKKIWKRLKSGKIVKKSVKLYNKSNNVNSFQSTMNNQTTIS